MSGLRLDIAPFQKMSQADIAKRMVWGVATMETEGPDHQNDIVDYDASVRAFKRWERNVREMHTNKAVGRCISVIPMPREKKILVGVRISDGAPDTWAKVLDGTLRAFSIGGYPKSEHKEWNAKSSKFVNRITDYALTELSLVDSPANPECRVTLLTKRNDQKLASDVLAEVQETPMNKETKAAARDKFVSFAKTLGGSDELVLVRKSDIIKGEDGGVALKTDATVETLTKAEAEEGVVPDLDEHQEEGEHEQEGGLGEDDITDLEGAAEAALEIHDVLHDLAGQECNCDGEGEGEGEPEDHEHPESEEGDYEKARRARMRKRQTTMSKRLAIDPDTGQTVVINKPKSEKKKLKKKLKKMLAKAIGTNNEALAKALDTIAAKVGAEPVSPMIRKGNVEKPDTGTPPAVNGKTTAGALVKNATGDLDAQAVDSLTSHLKAVRKEADTLIRKRDSGVELNAEEKVRLTTIGDDLGKAKISYQVATGRSADDVTP